VSRPPFIGCAETTIADLAARAMTTTQPPSREEVQQAQYMSHLLKRCRSLARSKSGEVWADDEILAALRSLLADNVRLSGEVERKANYNQILEDFVRAKKDENDQLRARIEAKDERIAALEKDAARYEQVRSHDGLYIHVGAMHANHGESLGFETLDAWADAAIAQQGASGKTA